MWPFFADLYTPLLALLVCWVAYEAAYLKTALIRVILVIALVVGFSALERKAGLWHSWGLDYSTHTAVLLPFYQMLLILARRSLRNAHPLRAIVLPIKAFSWLIFALVTGLGYGVLMMQLGYHTFADILTTVISTYPLVWISFHLLGAGDAANPQTKETA